MEENTEQEDENQYKPFISPRGEDENDIESRDNVVEKEQVSEDQEHSSNLASAICQEECEKCPEFTHE